MEITKRTIDERLKLVIEVETSLNGRFAKLFQVTGISANSWKSFWHSRQRPTSEMIEAICVMWPQFAFWISTGRCDSVNGHVAPSGIEVVEIKRNTVTYFDMKS